MFHSEALALSLLVMNNSSSNSLFMKIFLHSAIAIKHVKFDKVPKYLKVFQ